MSQVLYRKYRSQDFDELIGQEHITNILKNAVKSAKLSHAYLFVGSRGTGKTSTARILARAINCKNPKKDGNPCNKCEVCKAITEGNYLDLIEIDAASNRGIDQIRELKEKLEFSPSEGDYKIYIIDEVHMLTKEAFNALLKTLEEPPAHVIFVLATTDVHKLPATILSRCQRYDFKLGDEKQIKKVLEDAAKKEKVKLEKGAMDILVENAHGSYRDALSLLDVVVSGQLASEKPEEVSEGEVRKVLGIPDTTMVYYLLEKINKKDAVSALELLSELDSKGVNLQQFTKYVLNMLRDILVKQMKGGVDPEEYSFASEMSTADTINMINEFLVAERSLKSLSTPLLALELVVAKLVGEEGNTAPPASEKRSESQEQEQEEEEEDIDTDPVNLTIEEIKSGWEKVVEEIKPSNGHLFAFLGSAKLVDVENGALKIEVPFEFHKERIEAAKSRDAMNSVFKKVFGSAFRVICEVNESVKKKRPVSADVVLQSVPKTEQKVVEKVDSKIEEIFKDM